MTQLSSGTPAPHPSPGRRRFIASLIIVTVALFIFMVGALYYYSWWKVYDNTSVVLIEGPPSLAGTAVTIRNEAGESVLLKLGNDEAVRQVSLPPGFYSISVQFPGDSQPMSLTPNGIRLQAYRAYPIDLAKILQSRNPSPKQPATSGS